MLNLLDTRIVASQHANVTPGIVIADEGIALVWKKVNGVSCVQPSAGVAGEVFAGFSYSRSVPPTFLPKVEQGVVPVGAQVKLTRAPITGQLLVQVGGVTLTAGTSAPTDNTTYQLAADGQTLVLFSGQAGKAIVAQYMYAPTVEEAYNAVGMAPIGGNPAQVLPYVGRLVDAKVSTNYFDASQDWTDVLFAKLGANGVLEPADEATGLTYLVVENSPSATDPFLTVNFRTR